MLQVYPGRGTSSIIYKNHIEMREGIGQPGQRRLTRTATKSIESRVGTITNSLL